MPSKVKFASPSKVLAVPEPVITLLSALLFIVVPVIPVNCEPSPLYEVAVTIPAIPRWILLPTLMKSSTSTFGVMTPDLAVTTPTESTLVTSS